MKECFFKIGNHCFYQLKTNECIAINTDRNSIKKLVSIPSAYLKDVFVISKEEFEAAKQSVMSGL